MTQHCRRLFTLSFLLMLILDVLYMQLVIARVEISFQQIFGLSQSEVSQLGSTISYQVTINECMNRGGTPVSLWSPTYYTKIILFINSHGNKPSIFFLGASAEPTAQTQSTCVQQQKPASLEADYCYYRWRFGYFDMETYNNQPGTAFFHGMYNYSAFRSRQVMQNYNTITWYSNYLGSTKVFPHGYYNVLGVYQREISQYNLFVVDGPPVAKQDTPAPLSSYIIMCEVQGYVLPVITSTEMPQPTVVPSWKELTWAQKNWWVIFLIVAIIILVLLIAIIVFCYCTSIEEKPGPPINSLVLRERVGKPYIIGSKTPAEYPMQEMKYESGPTLEPGQEPLRQGRGFNFNPLVYNDPEEMAQNVPVVYNTDGDKLVYNDGDSVADDNTNNKLNTNKLFEKSQENNNDGDDSCSQRAPSASGKRHSTRRNKSRANVQTFSEVDLPEGEEINEANINL